jgi:hypothetical protein
MATLARFESEMKDEVGYNGLHATLLSPSIEAVPLYSSYYTHSIYKNRILASAKRSLNQIQWLQNSSPIAIIL